MQQEVPASGAVSGTRLRWTALESADPSESEAHTPRARHSEWEPLPVLRPSMANAAGDQVHPQGESKEGEVVPTPMEASAPR